MALLAALVGRVRVRELCGDRKSSGQLHDLQLTLAREQPHPVRFRPDLEAREELGLSLHTLLHAHLRGFRFAREVLDLLRLERRLLGRFVEYWY